MLPDSQQVHVAEVLLGGLFKPQVDASAHTPEDRLHYEFHPSVRPLVQDTIPPERLFQTLSLWLHHRFGCSLEDFRAYLLTEGTARVKPFAGILLELLKRRGHQYADIIADIEQVYRPQYSSFAQLSQQEQANQDYQIRVRPGTSGIAVLAIHGGNLQPGTTEIAAAIAGEKHAFYSFVSRKPEIDQSLYLSSTQFDEPAALEMVRNARTVLSIHGAQGSDEFVLLEGLDRDRRDLIRAELTKADFSVLKKEYPGGIDPDNICNRGRTGKGVQLEISRGLRDRFLQGDRETSRFNAFIAIVQRCLETAILDDPEAAALSPDKSPPPDDLTWADFPPLETLEFRTAQLVDTLESPPFPPPLATETFQIATLSFEPASPEPEPETTNLQRFEFEIGTLIKIAGEWTIQRQPQSAYQFVEALTTELSLELVAIPAGIFPMGSPEQEPQRSNRESPQHQVSVPAFFIGKYPITQAQWRVVASFSPVTRELNPDPSRFKGDNRPVERVSWDAAVEFCARLTRHTGRPYRLPSEAEWEYACRAGTTTPFQFGQTITPELANYRGNVAFDRGPTGEFRRETTPVGSFPANAFGIYDMHGNVWEWCADSWHENYQDTPNDGSIWSSSNENPLRVNRGGSWNDIPRYCRSAYRGRDNRSNMSGFIGFISFRVVCVAP